MGKETRVETWREARGEREGGDGKYAIEGRGYSEGGGLEEGESEGSAAQRVARGERIGEGTEAGAKARPAAEPGPTRAAAARSGAYNLSPGFTDSERAAVTSGPKWPAAGRGWVRVGDGGPTQRPAPPLRLRVRSRRLS